MMQSRASFNLATRLSARSPAKLIISGEHSVLYGQAAIAMAVNRYTTSTTSWSDIPHIHFKLADLAYAKSHTLKALGLLTKQLQQDYTDFLKGNVNIRSVIKRPFELLQFSVSKLIDYLKVQLPNGVEIAVDSNIPMGCGMGSSASSVISTIYALTNLLGFQLQPEEYLKFGREIENLQHGRSSGLDLHLVTYGGCVRFQDGAVQLRQAPTMPLYIVNTGQPQATTGECVAKVASAFARNRTLAEEFGVVTDAVDRSLATGNLVNFKQAIQANHKLLQSIGVVPTKIAGFIRDIEMNGGAAKTCGAGSITGDNAGIVLIVADQDLQSIVTKHGYQLQTIEVDIHGTTII